MMPDAAPLAADPFARFKLWLAEAEASESIDPNAMIVVTATPDGKPSARAILLKGLDDRGFVFYTNKQSRKSNELAANPAIFLLFYWKSLGRQIRIEGDIEDVTDAEADAYFASRPRISRLGAWASDQSRPLADREELERRLAENEARFPGEDIPRPPYWSGYRVIPRSFEFWQGMDFRLHDRTTYTRAVDGSWTVGKLFP
jgi:pyridoxamine 5'-phosphate oxidase